MSLPIELRASDAAKLLILAWAWAVAAVTDYATLAGLTAVPGFAWGRASSDCLPEHC